VVTEPRILVKAEIYRGEGKQVEQANYFWDTLTKQEPAKRWYPSVGGRPTAPKECGPRGCVVKAVLWTNITFTKAPINQRCARSHPCCPPCSRRGKPPESVTHHI
jgi:hypothetical protein